MKRNVLISAVIIGWLISGTAYAGFDWGDGSGQCSGDGTFQQNIPYYNIIEVGEIPSGKEDVYIQLISDEDVDIQLYDKSTGENIVHWPDGILNESGHQSTNYYGVNIEWSGYNGDGTGQGHEYIRINGKTNRALIMKAFGYREGYATVNYSWQGTEGCMEGGPAESGSGTFQQQIAYYDLIKVGDLIPGLNDVYIELNSDNDVDIQLYDGNTKIVHWPDGILSGLGYQSTSYDGMTIEWSGYNGDGTDFGHEYIRITGKINRTLTMKAFGYRAGYATVNYSWGEEELVIDNFFSQYFPSSNINNIEVSKNGNRLDVTALRQRDYSYEIGGTDYAVAGCVPTTYAMALDYGMRSNGYAPAVPEYAIELLLSKFDKLGVLSTDGAITSVNGASDKFIDSLEYEGVLDLYKNCQAPTDAKLTIKRITVSDSWSHSKFISSVKKTIDLNRPVIVAVALFRLDNEYYDLIGGHQMLITGYDDNLIYANDTWNVFYTTWERVEDIDELTFYKDGDDITSKIINHKKLNTNVIYKKGDSLIILYNGDASFAIPEKIEFYYTTPIDLSCLS